MIINKIIIWSSLALMAAIPAIAQQNVNIQVQIPAASDPSVTVSLPVDGNYFESNLVTKKLDASNKISINVPLKIGGIVKIVNVFRSTYLIAAPGEKFEVIMYPGKKAAKITGNNATGQELYNVLFENNTNSRYKELDKYPSIAKRILICDSLKSVDLQKFKDLLKDKKITSNFYNSIVDEADMYYKLLLSADMFFTLRSSAQSVEIDKNNPPNPDFVKAWLNIYQDVNNNKKWLKSQFFRPLMGWYSALQQLKDKSPRENGTLGIINDFKKLLNGPTLEYAWATHIVSGLSMNYNEKFWLTNWAEFKAAFPNSKLIQPLVPVIQKVEAYHQTVASVSKEVEFLKDYTQINSLEELGQRLKGSVCYVDLWATWCLYCKLEFKYSIKLHDEIEKLGVKPVYLSIDNDKADAKWQEMVKGFPLKGINLRAGENLTKDIWARLPKFTGIPRYLIFNAKGEMVNNDAKRPSEMKELLEQLKTIE